MGFIIRFILFVVVFSWIIRALRRLIFGMFYKRKFNQYNNQQSRAQQEKKTPETQQDRILDFQRKKFETTEVEDAEYEEIR